MLIAVGLVIVMAWLVGGVTLYLHFISRDYGALPLSFFLAGMIAMLDMFEFSAFFVVPVEGIGLFVTSDIIIPSTLLIILVLYVANGTRAAQMAIGGIVGVGAMVFGILLLLWLQTALVDPKYLEGDLTEPGAISLEVVWRMFSGRVAYITDMLVIVIVFQAVHNRFPHISIGLTSGVALLAALWTDATVYNGLTELTSGNFWTYYPAGLFVKTIVGTTLAPLLALYLEVFLPRYNPNFASNQDRPVFDVLSNSTQRMMDLLHDAETEVSARTHIYEQLIDSLNEYILWLADPSGDRPVYYISPGFERITGYPPDEVYNHPAALLPMIHPDDRTRFQGSIIDYWMTATEDEFRILRPDGEVRWLRSRVSPIRNEAGEIVRVGGMVEDITAQKSASDRQFALALEQERVRLLENFIRDASHDLRTPISSLTMSLHILKSSPDAAMRQRHLDALENRISYLNRLIDNLFTLTKVESGGTGEFLPIDLAPILRDTTAHLMPVALEKGLSVSTNVPADLPLVWGDRVQLERALSNLIENAIRYTMEGGVTVTARADDEEQLFLEIRDTGIGIAPEDLPRLFDRFFRAPAAAKHRIQGTGLGLSIVKSVIERHHGRINVASTPDAGTTFEIWLPIYRPVLEQIDDITIPASPAAENESAIP